MLVEDNLEELDKEEEAEEIMELEEERALTYPEMRGRSALHQQGIDVPTTMVTYIMQR